MTDGVWAIIAEFDGPWHAWQMEEVREIDLKDTRVIPVTDPTVADFSALPAPGNWASSLSEQQYVERVGAIQELIAQGGVQQLNLCRVLSLPVDEPPSAQAVSTYLQAHHPAPFAGWFDFAGGTSPRTWLVSSSPELSVRVSEGVLRASPIKGTAPTADGLLEKDYAENRLVTAHLRERINQLCTSAAIVDPCTIEQHPTLVQLVSHIEGNLKLDPAATPAVWGELLEILHPPLSVAGVPRDAALNKISELEPTERGPYCGTIGWIDVDRGECLLAAAIRSFWWEAGELKFGTGAGITAGSDPQGEWQETELKAGSLLGLLSAGAHA